MKTIAQMVRQKLKKSRPRKKKQYMAKKKYGKRRSSGRGGLSFGSVTGILRNPTIQKTALSLGLGTVVALVASRVAPQFTPWAALGGEYLGGGVVGLIGAEAVKALAGASSILGSFGGGGQQGGFFVGGGAA